MKEIFQSIWKNIITLLGNEHGQILKKANNFELYFETDELDSLIRKLKEYEVEFIMKLRNNPGGKELHGFMTRIIILLRLGSQWSRLF